MTVVIPGRPVPQPRPKVCRRGAYSSVYTPDNGIVAFRQEIALRVRAAMAGKKHLGPVEVWVRLELTRPASHWSVTKKRGRELKETAPAWVVDGDLDNYEKGILDALNGIAWGDDIQVVRKIGEKAYGDENQTIVTIREAVT